jgi:hypothetical protein
MTETEAKDALLAQKMQMKEIEQAKREQRE